MLVLMTLMGRQRRPRMKKKWCPRHMPRSRAGALPQGDLFRGVAEFPCVCLRTRAREWWLIQAKTVRLAREIALAWPNVNHGGRVMAHERRI
jgi:hypothetical protein